MDYETNIDIVRIANDTEDINNVMVLFKSISADINKTYGDLGQYDIDEKLCREYLLGTIETNDHEIFFTENGAILACYGNSVYNYSARIAYILYFGTKGLDGDKLIFAMINWARRNQCTHIDMVTNNPVNKMQGFFYKSIGFNIKYKMTLDIV